MLSFCSFISGVIPIYDDESNGFNPFDSPITAVLFTLMMVGVVKVVRDEVRREKEKKRRR